MLNLALNTQSERDSSKTLEGVLQKGAVTGIHAAFSDLRLYNHLFAKPNKNIFLLLGNRLAKTTGQIIPVDGGLTEGFLR